MGHYSSPLPLQLVLAKKRFTFHNNPPSPRKDQKRDSKEMTHLALPWWPKTTSATASGGDAHGRSGTATATAATTTSNSSRTEAASTNCCGLSKLMRRLKKRSKTLHPASRQSSFQCRYDPLSYSLNFDKSGSGDFLDEDYYKFYAFSSRFVATPRTDCQRLVAASH